MKLAEFSMWPFKLDLDSSRRFTLFGRCVIAHFERLFNPIETDGVYRVVVKICERDERIGTTEISSSVLKYYRAFDFNYFDELGLVEKKQFILDELYKSLICLCEIYGWRRSFFDQAYEGVIREEFKNVYTIKKKLNRNRNLSAELIGDHNEKSFDCSLIIKDNNNNKILSERIFSEEPDEFLFNSRIGDIKWVGKSIVVYQSKNKQELARFNVEGSFAE